MRNVVVIGASNVTLGLPVIWRALSQRPGPTRLFVAAGHGRSYGMPNTVLGRTLPSILECRLWKTLDEQLNEPDETVALITDVGNDILYGAPVSQIVDWVAECSQRCEDRGARVFVTTLPRESLASLSPARFGFFRRMLFPSSRLTFEDGMSQANDLNRQLTELVTERSHTLVPTERHWYGADPIHIRRRCRPEAWQQFLSPLLSDITVQPAGVKSSIKVWRRKAAVRWRGKRCLETTQPVFDQTDSQLWLF